MFSRESAVTLLPPVESVNGGKSANGMVRPCSCPASDKLARGSKDKEHGIDLARDRPGELDMLALAKNIPRLLKALLGLGLHDPGDHLIAAHLVADAHVERGQFSAAADTASTRRPPLLNKMPSA
ncbi:hypothetical protein [Bradyrhizobium sp. WSM1253]|uniref:hypothetical protein n=1 Tax=Bradyrhizobium sp. WSM1253 TaxID=319003 RepID=UPI0012F4B735|nr:hypothetical protein [Bradyrhizobium sp. WSM1253]